MNKCNKCQCPIIWDTSIESPIPKEKRKKDGWWKEDLTKQTHTRERCQQFQNSKEFFEKDNIKRITEDPEIDESKLKRIDLLDIPKILTDEEREAVETITRQFLEVREIMARLVKDVDVSRQELAKFILEKIFERRRLKLES